MTILDSVQQQALVGIDEQHKAEWGQFFTSSHIARFMATLFSTNGTSIRLLDPGAGIGSLSAAFLDLLKECGNLDRQVQLTAYEIDPTLLPYLSYEVEKRQRGMKLEATISQEDFIESAVNLLQFQPHKRYSHAILNPPYKKIAANSRPRRLLRQVGIETVNLYTGFVALAVALLEPGGQLVAITPRSFCNGPYYRSFREFVLNNCALHHIHLFEARDKAFREDGVLQENIIFLLTKGIEQGDVTVSTSKDDRFADYAEHTFPFSQIVLADDLERFIHIPADGTTHSLKHSPSLRYSLDDLGIQVSTGPVVDFRVKEYLRAFPESGSAPLFYPGHFVGNLARWPLPSSRKPNAIIIHQETKRWLYPTGFYTVARRFSSKEESRRIVASLITPEKEYGSFLGFENHLNIFHKNRSGLPEMLARGLVTYLNSSRVDRDFRRFSGHTQVNATDLRNMSYPSQEVLISLGCWSKDKQPVQDEIDRMIESLG